MFPFLVFSNHPRIYEKLPKDVVSGNRYSKVHTAGRTFKKYGMQVVDKKDGHPIPPGDISPAAPDFSLFFLS